MAENKKSFVAYCDWGEIFENLEDKQAGKLAKHMFDYVRDLSPKSDKLTELLFITIKQSLKRDLRKYEVYKEKQKANGKKGGRPKAKETQITQAFISKPKKADNVNVNDNDINTIVLNTESIDKWILELKTQTQFLDGLYMTHKLRQNTLGKIAMLFKEHLKMHPKNHENFIDFRNHFGTWVGFKIKKGELGEYLKHQKGEL